MLKLHCSISLSILPSLNGEYIAIDIPSEWATWWENTLLSFGTQTFAIAMDSPFRLGIIDSEIEQCSLNNQLWFVAPRSADEEGTIHAHGLTVAQFRAARPLGPRNAAREAHFEKLKARLVAHGNKQNFDELFSNRAESTTINIGVGFAGLAIAAKSDNKDTYK